MHTYYFITVAVSSLKTSTIFSLRALLDKNCCVFPKEANHVFKLKTKVTNSEITASYSTEKRINAFNFVLYWNKFYIV